MKTYQMTGPYVARSGSTQGRRYVNLKDEAGNRTTMLYSRWLVREALGRELGYDETVDHIDNDKTNDRLDNLQLLTRSENSKKSA